MPSDDELERARSTVDPGGWQYYRKSSLEGAAENIAEYDKALAIAAATPDKEPFDLERLYEIYGFEGAERELVLTQDNGILHLTGYYIRHPEIKTLAEYASYLDWIDHNGGGWRGA